MGNAAAKALSVVLPESTALATVFVVVVAVAIEGSATVVVVVAAAVVSAAVVVVKEVDWGWISSTIL